MLNFNRIAISIIFAAAAASASAIGPTGTPADYGVAVPGNTAERTIVLTPDTKYVYVTNGETVRFTSGGKSFSWHVDTYPNVYEFPLQAIAPADMAPAGVRVFVEPNPLYFGA